MTGRLYGRHRVVEFTRSALRRQETSSRPVPIVVLTGPRGSGGTALLERILADCGQDCLKVSVDLAGAQGADDAVLAAMAGLSERVRGIRPIRFARLGMAVKALTYLGGGEGGDGRAGFDPYMRAARRYATAESRLDDWAGRASTLLASPEQQLLAVTAGKAVGGLLDRLGRVQEKAVLAWFAHRAGPQPGSPYDPLWKLYTARHDPAPASGRLVDKTLCAALLADLRADFNDARLLYGRRVSNPLLLFDNADNQHGHRLLELLTECRREQHNTDDGPADPAVVVAVRHGRPPAALGTPIAPTDARLVHPPTALAPPDTDHPLWWIPVRLTDLGPDDVAEMCRSSVLGSVRRDADLVHALTGGHAAATASLTVLLERFGRERFAAHDLLDTPLPALADLPRDWPDPDPAGMTVRDHLIRRVLPDLLTPGGPSGPVVPREHPLLHTVAVCAATPAMAEGAGRAALRYLRRTDDPGPVHDLLKDGLWLDRSPDGTGTGLHPLPALLLRRLLAAEPQRVWEQVHTGYLTYYAHAGDETLRHLHLLALVDQTRHSGLTAVTAHLERLAADRPVADWLAELDRITTAPNRLRTNQNREAVVTRLAGASAPGDRTRVVARLTVARWLFQDRSFDPGHDLAKVVADEYDHLAGLTDGDSEPLYQESARYRRLQREWEN